MCITPYLGCGEGENREEKKRYSGQNQPQTAGRNARRRQEKGKGSVSLFNQIFHCLENWLRMYL